MQRPGITAACCSNTHPQRIGEMLWAAGPSVELDEERLGPCRSNRSNDLTGTGSWERPHSRSLLPAAVDAVGLPRPLEAFILSCTHSLNLCFFVGQLLHSPAAQCLCHTSQRIGRGLVIAFSQCFQARLSIQAGSQRQSLDSCRAPEACTTDDAFASGPLLPTCGAGAKIV